jgi:hypothetical protein
MSGGAAIAQAVITPGSQFFNYIEAAVWIAMGIVATAMAARFSGRARRDLLILAATLIAFGLSDLVETRTGAWWRPPWLLAWKAACLDIMLGLLIAYLRRSRMGK